MTPLYPNTVHPSGFPDPANQKNPGITSKRSSPHALLLHRLDQHALGPLLPPFKPLIKRIRQHFMRI